MHDLGSRPTVSNPNLPDGSRQFPTTVAQMASQHGSGYKPLRQVGLESGNGEAGGQFGLLGVSKRRTASPSQWSALGGTADENLKKRKCEFQSRLSEVERSRSNAGRNRRLVPLTDIGCRLKAKGSEKHGLPTGTTS